jgi:hypothetical protein
MPLHDPFCVNLGHQTKIANALKKYIHEIETHPGGAVGYQQSSGVIGSSAKNAESRGGRDSHRGSNRSASNKKSRKANVAGNLAGGSSSNNHRGSANVSNLRDELSNGMVQYPQNKRESSIGSAKKVKISFSLLKHFRRSILRTQ